MAARSIALGWEIPAYGIQADIYQGEAITLTLTRAGGTTIAAWTITAYIKKFHDDATNTLTITGSLVSSGTSGIFTLALTAAQTLALANQGYWCEIWRTDSSSETLMSLLTLNVLEGL